MHRYMRAIGFSRELSRSEYQKLVSGSCRKAERKNYTSADGKTMIFEFCKDFGDGIGICVRGEYDDEDNLHYDYSFPYLDGTGISSCESITVERHAEKESYAGVCDELKVGVSLIFYLKNMVAYLKYKNSGRLPVMSTSLTLSALSVKGSILFPIEKQKEDIKKDKVKSSRRNRLLEQARNGDEEAIENITINDMDTSSVISQRILREDVYTLVDTSFLAYGVECDQYSVIAEILECKTTVNSLTGEKIHIMKLSANDLEFDLCINDSDLLGEPMVGRRFKGVIWLQGHINYPD